jgi:hypothetical protein
MLIVALCYAECRGALKVEVLHYTRLESLAMHQHSGLLDPFVSHEENEVL